MVILRLEMVMEFDTMGVIEKGELSRRPATGVVEVGKWSVSEAVLSRKEESIKNIFNY